MITDKTARKWFLIIVIAVLAVLSFLIFQPVILSVLFALVVAYTFYPLYKRVLSIIRERNISALIICIGVFLIIFLAIWFLTPIILDQIFKIYQYTQTTDVVGIIANALIRPLTSPEAASKIALSLNSLVNQGANALLSQLTNIIIELPNILFQLAILIFVFFFALRDGDKFVAYLKSLSPLGREAESVFIKSFRDMTYTVIYSHIIVGIAQGLVLGLGLLIFGVPNALFYTLLACFFSVLPIVGAWLVWIPIVIYLFGIGQTGNAIGLLLYSAIIVSWMDNILRPLFVSRKTKMNSGIVLVSMIGGLIVFGALGLLLGPLIIAYLMIVLDLYRQNKFKDIFSS
jgi:predicted PurR-regulated permease PerM